MNTLATLLALTLALPAYAGTPVKTCQTTLSLPGDEKKVESLFEVFVEDGKARAVVTQGNGEQKLSYPETAEIAEYSVRENVGAADIDELNRGEGLVAHALLFTKEFSEVDLDLDLEDVRKVKVFQIGKATNFGSSSLVESYDAKGKLLGTFLGGFLVSECR